MADESPEKRIYQLEQQNVRLQQRLEKAAAEWKKAQRHRRDEYLAAILGGLCANWAWEDTPPERLALKAEQLVDRVMQLRAQRDAGTSPLDHKERAKAYRKLHPIAAVGAAPTAEAPKDAKPQSK